MWRVRRLESRRAEIAKSPELPKLSIELSSLLLASGFLPRAAWSYTRQRSDLMIWKLHKSRIQLLSIIRFLFAIELY
jgi:hypothetical protein